MKRTIAALGITTCLLIAPSAHAAWTGPDEIIMGKWGAGKGQFGMRSEGGLNVLPSLDAVASDDSVIIHDPVNKRLLLFDSGGARAGEVSLAGTRGKDRYARSVLEHRMREAQTVLVQKAAAESFSITAVFSDRNAVVSSDQDFRQAMCDVQGNVYGLVPNAVLRFDKSGKQTDVLNLPASHEELVTVPGQPAPRGMYVIFGEPVIGPTGSVYLSKKTDSAFSILKWTWR